jgi:outer membrane protein assembly factor BamB
VPPFAEMLAKHDQDKNGTLELGEMPAGPLKDRFNQIDADKDGHITLKEFQKIRDIVDKAVNRMVAIKPGGSGDITESHVLWAQEKYLPYVPSPLCYQGHLFMVKNGGILTSVECKNGTVVKQERVAGTASYYASPVGGDGKIYVVSQRGELTVISAQGQWQEISRARMGEDVFATPALVDGKIYLRTAGHLYCFGE